MMVLLTAPTELGPSSCEIIIGMLHGWTLASLRHRLPLASKNPAAKLWQLML
jgi:hypothetical protein